jgi:hypothetical protein
MTDDLHALGAAALHQVVEDRVHYVLVKNTPVSITKKVKLEALELETRGRRNVMYHDCTEIGLPRLGADSREFRARDLDFIVALRELVGEGLDQGRHLMSSELVTHGSGGNLQIAPYERRQNAVFGRSTPVDRHFPIGIHLNKDSNQIGPRLESWLSRIIVFVTLDVASHLLLLPKGDPGWKRDTLAKPT